MLLENAADVNAKSGLYGTPLEEASKRGAKTMVQLLLGKGAIANSNTMKLASESGNEEVKTLIRNALKSQSPSVHGPMRHFH